MRTHSLGLGLLLLVTACGGDDTAVTETPGSGGGAAGSTAGASGSGAAGAGAAGKSGAGATAGSAGSAGVAGKSGAAGSSGAAGVAGMAGAAGAAGAATGGAAGEAGTAGAAGEATAGSSGAAGDAGAAGTAGAAGSGLGGASGAAGTTGGSGAAGKGGGGEVCVSGILCGLSATCCGAEEECVKQVCKAACASGVRCGDADTCCNTGDVCIAGACTTPANACEDYADCEEDQFCDPVLGKCLPQVGEPACVFKPPVGDLTPVLEWSWTDSVVNPGYYQVINVPLVADMDKVVDPTTGKTHPEVVIVTSKGYNTSDPAYLRLLDGRSGQERWDGETDAAKDIGRVQARSTPALGDIDGDGKLEIVALKFGGGLIAFNADGSIKWTSTAANGTPSITPFQSAAVTLADLDGDGQIESVVGGLAYSSTGKLLFDKGIYFGSNTSTYGAVSIVADVVGDAKPELLSGKQALNADGTELWAINEADGYPAIGDLDLDGNPELVVVSTKGGNAEVRVQDAATGEVKARLAVPGTGAGGPPTIAQFDGKGGQDFALANGDQYAVFTYVSSPTPKIDLLWNSPTQDKSSNRTGSTVFDFEGDGKAEVIYNDECYLRVYRGSDGAVIFKTANSSATIQEYPVIADVDGDNNTEIVVGGNDANNVCSVAYKDTGEVQRHGLFVYGDQGDKWVRTRRIWNQHAYHVTNVGTDGSIPAVEPKSWGPDGFNNYRQSTQGKQAFNAPDLAVTLEVSLATCGTGLKLRAHVKNEGSVTAPAGIDVTFYQGTEPVGTVLSTAKTVAPLLPGGIEDVDFLVPGALDFSAYYVIADGNAAGVGFINECIEGNNTGTSGLVSCSKD
jgi:hypothetical protein